jgi:hypothetical protein
VAICFAGSGGVGVIVIEGVFVAITVGVTTSGTGAVGELTSVLVIQAVKKIIKARDSLAK